MTPYNGRNGVSLAARGNFSCLGNVHTREYAARSSTTVLISNKIDALITTEFLAWSRRAFVAVSSLW
jgi:hypothetical protein